MVSVVLCAAGGGTRTGFCENKILADVGGMPALCYSLSAFAPFADEMIVVCRKEDESRISPLLSPYPGAILTEGGKTRFESVLFALRKAKGETVLIHDAARPFVSAKIIRDCLECVEKYGSGVCSLPATDTTVLAQNGVFKKSLPRAEVFPVQTPQGFSRKKLLEAYERAAAENRENDFTDDGGVYSAYVEPVRLFCGEPSNRKLTFAQDFALPCRVGFGTDTHAFDHQEEIDRGIARLNLNLIRLGGVAIPSNRAIKAHSDGDVVLHALTDALYSALSLRDIGFYFPDSDPKWKGADSMIFLKDAKKRADDMGFFVQNVSISILAEQPRLSPYIEEMRKNISLALDCENVAIAAGTNEKLGYIGQGRGITAYAFVLLKNRRPTENF